MNAKHLLSKVTMLLVTSLLLLTACAPATPAAPAKDMSDPVTVVQTFYELFNANQIDQAMALTAPDYVMNDPFGTYDRDAAAVQWKAVRDGGTTFNQTNFVNTGDGRVTSCYDVIQNGNSIDKGCGNVTHVRDGKIIFDGLESAEKLWIVQKYYEALSAKDLDLAMPYLAVNMVASDTTGYYYGTDEIAAAIQRAWDTGASIEASDFKLDGDRVLSCYQYYENGTLLDHNCTGVTRVRNGKIVFDGLVTNEALFVVQEYYEALNAKDVDAAMSWVAPDALFANPTGKYEGAAEIRGSLEVGARDGLTFELSKFHMIGSKVIYDYKVMQGTALLDQGTNGLTIVQDGQIVFDGTENTYASR